MLYNFPRFYLVGGVTTAEKMAPYADLVLLDAINAGNSIGPNIDVAAPYLNGPGLPILKSSHYVMLKMLKSS
jgi:enamidase